MTILTGLKTSARTLGLLQGSSFIIDFIFRRALEKGVVIEEG